MAESGADTRERNRLLRRGSLTHVSDFTAQSPCCLTHSANGKQGFADSLRRASGAPLEEAWGENFIFTPYNPHQTTVKQWFGFLAGTESFQPFLGPYRHYQQQLADIPIFTPCEKNPFFRHRDLPGSMSFNRCGGLSIFVFDKTDY